MADIRIKDLPTTATQTSSDDFIALDGTTNGTRKLSAYNPSFGGAITGVSLTAPTTTNLTLAGGSTGASLVLGQGANANASVAPAGTGSLIVTKNSTGNNVPGIILKNGAAGYTELDLYSGVSDAVKLVLQSSDANSFAAVSVGTNHPLLFGINGSERMRIATTGNLLIGTTTDSGNGKLQLATHTTSAGGIGFGTDLSLYRGNTGLLILNDASGALDARIGLYNNGTVRGLFEAYNVNTAIWMGAASAGWSTIITSGNQVPTLTLASNQAATFAGAVTVASASASLALSGSDSKLLFTDTGVGATSRNWAIAASQAAEGDFSIFVSSAVGGDPIFGTKALGFDRTGSATFAGAVSVATSLTAQTGIITGTNSAASYSLTVKNNALKAGASQYTGILIQTADASPVDLGLLYFTAVSATDRGWRLGAFDNANSTWSKGSFPGAISIGDTTPSTGAGSGALQVAGGIYSGAASVFAGNVTYGAAGKLYASATNELTFETAGAGGSAYFHILNPGNSDWKMGTTGGTTNFRLFGGATEVMNITTTGAATFAGTVIAPAATTAISSVRLPHGTAPTSPVNGDMWTTTAGLYVRINGVTVGPLS